MPASACRAGKSSSGKHRTTKQSMGTGDDVGSILNSKGVDSGPFKISFLICDLNRLAIEMHKHVSLICL